MHDTPRSATGVRHRTTLIVAPALLTLAACSADAADPSPRSSVPATASPAASTPASSPTTSPSTSVASAPSQPTRCTDAAGDGGPVDITAGDIAPAADGVRVTWTTTQSVATIVATAPSVLFNVTVVRADGNQVTDLGVRGSHGQFDNPFVFDFSASKQTATSSPATIDGTTITATYPADVINTLGPSWTRSASTTYDVSDVDRCPDAAPDTGADPKITAGT